MPTENRSSITEMVSVPREHELKIRQTPLADLLSGLKTGEVRDCSDREFAVGDTVLLREIDDSRDYTGTVLRRTITHVQKNYGLPDHLCVLSYGQPAPQPHPDPIAWMVGTAFWWTKEEAERDAAATGLQAVAVGPMTATVPADQAKPVGEVVAFGEGLHEIAWAQGKVPRLGAKLYTHADPAEVERLRAVIDQQKSLIASLRAELVESYSIDASAEPSASIEYDHDALVAAVCVLRSQGLGNLSEAVESARAALECKQ